MGLFSVSLQLNMVLKFVSRGRWRGIAGRSRGYLPGSKVLLSLFCSCCVELRSCLNEGVGDILSKYKSRASSPSMTFQPWPSWFRHHTTQNSCLHCLHLICVPTHQPQLDWTSKVVSLYLPFVEHELQVSYRTHYVSPHRPFLV